MVRSYEELKKAYEEKKKKMEEMKDKGVMNATVEKVEVLTAEEILPEDYIDKYNIDPTAEYLFLTIKDEIGDIHYAKLRYVDSKRANLTKYSARYGFPEPGQKIKLVYDPEKDYWKVLL